jgi:sugar lactone lactonase YvrE
MVVILPKRSHATSLAEMKLRSIPLLFTTVVGIALTLLSTHTAKSELVYVSLDTAVVRFDLSSGNATTIAATKTNVATGLGETMGMVFGGDGHLYATQYNANSVVSIDVSNGTKTTFATGFTNPRGITYSSATGNFYVANSNNPGSISEVTSGGAVSTYLSSGIRAPYGVSLDASGAMYIGNNGDATLTKVVGGTPTTFATFTPGSGTRGTSVDADGNIYTTVANGVKKTTPLGVTTDFITSGIGFPFGLAWSSSGNLYATSYTENLVYAFDSLGNSLYSFSAGGGSSNRPRFVAFDVEGSGFNQIQNAAVPEPGQVAASLLLLVGIGGYVAMKRRRVAKQAA